MECVLFGVFCDRYDANRLLILQMLFTAMMLAVLLVMDDTSSCSDCRALGARERIAAANITENRGTHRRISAHNIPEVQVVSHRFSGYVHGI